LALLARKPHLDLMKSIYFFLSPVLAPFLPGLTVRKCISSRGLLIWVLVFGLLTVAVIRLAMAVPHEKSPELSRVYDWLLYSQAFAVRVFLSGGVLWLLFRFLVKKKTDFTTLLALTGLVFLPLHAAIAVDTLYLDETTRTAIVIAGELWHWLALAMAVKALGGLKLKSSLGIAFATTVLMLIFFDDIWGLSRMLP